MRPNTVKAGSRELPIAGYVETKQTGAVPLADAPMISDYEWHKLSLKSRLESPDFYRRVLGENVEAVIAQLRRELEQYGENGMPLVLSKTRRAQAN